MVILFNFINQITNQCFYETFYAQNMLTKLMWYVKVLSAFFASIFFDIEFDYSSDVRNDALNVHSNNMKISAFQDFVQNVRRTGSFIYGIEAKTLHT